MNVTTAVLKGVEYAGKSNEICGLPIFQKTLAGLVRSIQLPLRLFFTWPKPQAKAGRRLCKTHCQSFFSKNYD